MTEGDGDDVERNETAAERGRSQLADVERDDQGGEADAETDDETTDGHDPVGIRTVSDGLHDCCRVCKSAERLTDEKRADPNVLAPIMKMRSARPMTSLRPMWSACARVRQ